MLRKFILGTAAAAATLVFGATAVQAAPQIVIQPGTGGIYRPPANPRILPIYPTLPTYPRQLPPRVDYDYVVFVKRGVFSPWERYAVYDTLRQAERVERLLERQGFRVRIEEVRVLRPRW